MHMICTLGDSVIQCQLDPPCFVTTGGAPWIGGGFEDTINEFLTYREALTLRCFGQVFS